MVHIHRYSNGAFLWLWAGEHRDYDFTSGEFRSSDVTIGGHRFEVVKRIAGTCVEFEPT